MKTEPVVQQRIPDHLVAEINELRALPREEIHARLCTDEGFTWLAATSDVIWRDEYRDRRQELWPPPNPCP